MLGVLFAFAMFAAPVVQNETGVDYLSMGPQKLCAVMGGKYDGTVETLGGNKESSGPATVPYCTAGPSTLVEDLLKDKGVVE